MRVQNKSELYVHMYIHLKWSEWISDSYYNLKPLGLWSGSYLTNPTYPPPPPPLPLWKRAKMQCSTCWTVILMIHYCRVCCVLSVKCCFSLTVTFLPIITLWFVTVVVHERVIYNCWCLYDIIYHNSFGLSGCWFMNHWINNNKFMTFCDTDELLHVITLAYSCSLCMLYVIPLIYVSLTLKVLVATIDTQWEGMGDVGPARYEPALLPHARP